MEIQEQVLSIEQMVHLKELGIDTSDASMAWAWDDVVPNNSVLMDLGYGGTPTYTIGDLIEKLPKHIESDDYPGDLMIDFGSNDLCYANWIGCEINRHLQSIGFDNGSLKDALYKCICWVAKNHKELLK